MTESDGEAVTKEDIGALLIILSAIMSATGAAKFISDKETRILTDWMQRMVDKGLAGPNLP